jgi:hypothetical protein
MKKLNARLLILSVVFAAFSVTSCKDKSKDNDTSTTTAVDSTTAAVPVISGDEELRKGVTDATKDYPGITADVTDSVINVSGEIKREDWQRLNPTLNSLHPKRVNSANLTIK